MTDKHMAYEEIQALRGMEEFKALSRRLRQVAENRKRLGGIPIPLPNYLFAADRGCGVTTHLTLLVRQLQEEGLLRFSGERPCFEWILQPSGSQWSFDRLLDELRKMAGFHSRFRGVVGLEIDGMVGEEHCDEFRRLLELVDSKQGEILFVFVVRRHAERSLTPLMQALSSMAPLEQVNFELPSAQELSEFLVKFLARRGFSIEEQAHRSLPEMMTILAAQASFSGFQTLENLADEIIYRLCTREHVSQPVVMPEDLTFITGIGGYIERMTERKHRMVGFGG